MKVFASSFLLMVMSLAGFAQQLLFAEAVESTKPASVFFTTSTTSIAVGGTLVVPCWLTVRTGDISAFSGSVEFNPSALRYTGMYQAVSGVGYVVNAQQPGKVGYAVAMPSAAAFPLGTQLVFNLNFEVLSIAFHNLAISGAPIAREVVNTSARNVDADHVVVSAPMADLFIAGPFWGFGPLVTIGVERSNHPFSIWRRDTDNSLFQVPDSACIILPQNGKKCTDTPKGGGRVDYYIEWDVGGYGKLASLPRSVMR